MLVARFRHMKRTISIILNDFEAMIDSPTEICRRPGNLCEIIGEGYESRLTS
jgi:hypothetical protein